MIPTPQVFVNFAARLDPISDERRRRLEKAYRLSAPRLLAVVLADYETRFLAQLSDAERAAYLGGADLNTPGARGAGLVGTSGRDPQ